MHQPHIQGMDTFADEPKLCKQCHKVAATCKCTDCGEPTHPADMGCSTLTMTTNNGQPRYTCNSCTADVAAAFAVHAHPPSVPAQLVFVSPTHLHTHTLTDRQQKTTTRTKGTTPMTQGLTARTEPTLHIEPRRYALAMTRPAASHGSR